MLFPLIAPCILPGSSSFPFTIDTIFTLSISPDDTCIISPVSTSVIACPNAANVCVCSL